MGYLAVWKVLEEMIIDLRKKGVVVSTDVMNNLKSARTMIKILKADPNRGETIQKIEEYLGNVESCLVSEGLKTLGNKYVDRWLRRLEEASKEANEKEETRFIAGLPREQKWIRVKPSAELPLERLKSLAKESGLSYKTQNDGYLLVSGEDECIKGFVKKMTAKYGLETKK